MFLSDFYVNGRENVPGHMTMPQCERDRDQEIKWILTTRGRREERSRSHDRPQQRERSRSHDDEEPVVPPGAPHFRVNTQSPAPRSRSLKEERRARRQKEEVDARPKHEHRIYDPAEDDEPSGGMAPPVPPYPSVQPPSNVGGEME